jgi:hypothetical protein
MGSTICLALLIVIAAASYIGLRYENARRDRLYGSVDSRIEAHRAEEDLSDKQNEEFRYVL